MKKASSVTQAQLDAFKSKGGEIKRDSINIRAGQASQTSTCTKRRR